MTGPLGIIWPLDMEFLSWPTAIALWVGLAVVIVALGWRSLTYQGPVRQWTAIGLRVGVVALTLLILGGLRWKQTSDHLTVMVLRDVSDSTSLVHDYPSDTRPNAPADSGVQGAIDRFLNQALLTERKRADDALGQISFATDALVASLPSALPDLKLKAAGQSGDGTDPVSAIQLALATMPPGTMHRMLLIWDGNATAQPGVLEQAVAAAAAAHIPIDVMPLRYHVTHEVILERVVAPAWQSPDTSFDVQVVLRSTNTHPVTGRLSVRLGETPLDMDAAAPGVQPARLVHLSPGVNVQHVAVPPLRKDGAHVFRATFDPAGIAVASGVDASIDTLPGNNTAEAFTFVRGQGRVLLVNGPAHEGEPTDDPPLIHALDHARLGVDVRRADEFPDDLLMLQNYDAVILRNVPMGLGGISPRQDQLLTSYVRDLGGGLVIIGGPDSFGAGGWQGSATSAILPVELDIPAKRELPRGALLLVLDHSGSMSVGVQGSTMDKQRIADEAAVQAVKALSRRDYVGVLSFDSQPTWVVPLGVNSNPDSTITAIRAIAPAGGTEIYPALAEAHNAMHQLPWSNVGVKHILLLTDGQSRDGDFSGIAQAIRQNRITLSTIGVGDDVDSKLLARLALLGGGSYYPVTNPAVLPQIFIKEATLVRRTLIQTDDAGMTVRKTPAALTGPVIAGIDEFPPIKGLVLTTPRNNPLVQLPLVAGPKNDPLLAHWQAGLGRTLAFTSDATGVWDPAWVGSSIYDKFWAQAIRQVARPPMAVDVELNVRHEDGRIALSVEAFNADATHRNFLSISGVAVGPQQQVIPIHLSQSGPGFYQGEFKAMQQGDYVMRLTYHGADGKPGILLGGVAVNGSAEMRSIAADEAAVNAIARKTGGRVLKPFDTDVNLFDREGLQPAVALTPIWRKLIPVLLALLLLDVAVRRLAWSVATFALAWQRMNFAIRQFIQSPSPLARGVGEGGAVGALHRVRQQAEASSTPPSHKPAARFEPQDVPSSQASPETFVTDDSAPPAAEESERPMSGLLEAKRRARRRMNGP